MRFLRFLSQLEKSSASQHIPLSSDNKAHRLSHSSASSIDPRSTSRLREALRQINHNGFYFNPSPFASLLQICGNFKLLDEGRQLHRFLENAKQAHDPYMVSFLIQMYVKCDQFGIAQDLFMSLGVKTVYLCNYMIGAFSKHGLAHESRCFFDQMMVEGLCPDRVTCVNIICLCAGHGSFLEQGRRFHSCLSYLGFEEDIVVSTSLISFYSKHGNPDEAIRMLDSIGERNVVSWNAMIGAFSQDMFQAGTLQSFEQILQEGLLPDRITFISVISGCAANAVLGVGKTLHVRVGLEEAKLDVKVASALIHMYGKCGQVANARHIFDALPLQNLFCWNAMIAAYAQRGFLKEALELLRLMKWNGITPDKVTMVSILSIYAQCGQFDDVRHIFEAIPDHNVISWNAIIAALVHQGKDTKALEYFEQMQVMGVVLDEVTFCSVLLCCSNQLDIGFGRRLHIQILLFGYDMDLYVTNSLINLYGKCGSATEANCVFRSLSVCDVVSWNTMMTTCTQHGESKDALQMFDQMKAEAVMPDEVTFLGILEAVQGLLTEGKRIDTMITSSRFRSQDAIVTALISMYGECGSLGAVRRLFDGLPEKNNAAWNVVISLHVQQGQGLDALQMFDEMLQIGVIPSHVTYISCIRACTSLCVLGKGKDVYTQMIHSESGPSTLSDTALVNLYSRCGKLVDARRVFDGISEHDVVSFNAMIAAYARHGYHKAAVEIFYGMLEERFIPDSLTFVHALSACSHAGLIDDGKRIFRLMRTKYGLDPGLEHYDCMIDALSRAGCLEEVHELIIRMPFKPSMISWTSALSSCGDVNAGSKVAHSMLEIDPMCYSSYVTLSNMCANVSEEKAKVLMRAKSSERKSFSLVSNTRVKQTSLTNVHQTQARAACSEVLARQGSSVVSRSHLQRFFCPQNVQALGSY